MPKTSLTRAVASYRLVWLAEIDDVIAEAPGLTEPLREAFDRGYSRGMTAVKIPESHELRRALAIVRS